MKKLLIILAFIGIILFGIFVNYYLKYQIFQSREVAAYEAGAWTQYEGTVMTLNEVRIPVGNYLVTSEEIPTIQVMHPDGPLTVAKGDTFEVNGQQFEVYDIFEDAFGHGRIAILEVK